MDCFVITRKTLAPSTDYSYLLLRGEQCGIGDWRLWRSLRAMDFSTWNMMGTEALVVMVQGLE